jgi:beta-glucanase (GH16 family)
VWLGAECAGVFGAPGARVEAQAQMAAAPPMPQQAASPLASGKYQLVFQDDFDGKSLDRSRWCTRLAYGDGPAPQVEDKDCCGPGGQGGTRDFLKDERQRYVDKNTKGETMHLVSDGTLKLRATKSRADSYATYEAAMIRSKYSFVPTGSTKYYMTSRVRLPNVRGTFCAMWLAPGFGKDGQVPWPPEIDIFEGALNERDDTANMIRTGVQVVNSQTDSGHEEFIMTHPQYDTKWNNFKTETSLRETWVEFGAEWSADKLCYYVNGTLMMCEKYRWQTNAGMPATAAQLIFNHAIGGEWAGRYGIDDTRFPTHMEIDYVRVYRQQ